MFRRVAPLCLLLASASSFAGIDAEVGNGDKITGTLSPATESETFRVRVPNGARISVKAKAAKKGPALHVVLSYPVAAALTADGKSASINAVASGSGLYSVTVTSQDGTSTGDYSLTISWKSVATFTKTSDLANAASDTLAFAADAGATATITAKPAKKSKATGILNGLTAPDSSVVSYSTASAKTPLALPGSYSLAFGNAGATQGLVTATVKLKLPKALKRKVVLTSKVIDPGGAKTDFAYANVLGPDGGTVTVPVILPGQPGTEISGSSVSVPPGVLATGSTIVIGTSPDIPLPASTTAGGPPVSFGPEGTRFDKNDKSGTATLSIPYSPLFDGFTNLIVVYTRDAKGKVAVVPQPYTFDVVHHTVSFATSHFSSYQAGGPQQTGGGGLLNAALNLADARDVTLGLGTTTVQFFVAGGSAKTVIGLTPGSQPTVLIYDNVTFAGGGSSTADGTTRLQFQFADPVTAVATNGADSSVIVATTTQIFVVDATDKVTRFAGTGATGDTGDGAAALSATFTAINSMVLDPTGALIVCDGGAHRIRAIDMTTFTIGPYAGTGTAAFGADNVALVSTTFLGPSRICAALVAGGIYVADGGRVRHLDTNGAVNVTVAGDAGGATGSTGDDGPLLSARFVALVGISSYFDIFNQTTLVDAIVVTDADHTVRFLSLANDKVQLAGGQHGQQGDAPSPSPATGLLDTPGAVVLFGGIALFVDQHGTKIREVIVQTP